MSSYVDIHFHEDDGFKILVQYQAWRTAMLNSAEANRQETFSYVEKHKETDEVFVLLKGKAFLIIGGDGVNRILLKCFRWIYTKHTMSRSMSGMEL